MFNYGLLFGFASIVLQLLIYIFGDVYEPHWAFMVLSLLVSIAFIVLGIKKVKESQGGMMSLGDAIKTGLGIALVSALVYSAYMLIFFNFIEPNYFENMKLIQEQKILESYPNLTDEQLESAKNNAAMFANTGVSVTMTIIVSLFMSLIISLVAGLIMRKTEEV